jgi:alkylation response protein AidB-like acyl-CoA dehydrogenase
VDFSYAPEDEEFRSELLSWLTANLPDFLDQGEIGPPQWDSTRRTMQRRQAWQRRLNEGGWAAINWPREWGGREATVMQNVIYSQEMAQAKTPGIYNANGIWQIGPMILRWGTDEQKQQWLPGILNATEHWCQGFTEPQAGATWPTCAPRRCATGRSTSSTVEDLDLDRPPGQVGTVPGADRSRRHRRGTKHEGITALIVDMEAPGIECRPIRDITGGEPVQRGVLHGCSGPGRLPSRGRGKRVGSGHGHPRPRAGGHRRSGHRCSMPSSTT